LERKHQYFVNLIWTGNEGTGTSGYRDYARSHTIEGENTPEILCSSDPLFLGDKTRYSPEDLLVGAVSGCHMLSYLHLCADSGIVVIDYRDSAIGIMLEQKDGSGYFSEITLHPNVTVTDGSMIEKANALHEKANKLCFIANSCKFKVYHKPVCKVMKGNKS